MLTFVYVRIHLNNAFCIDFDLYIYLTFNVTEMIYLLLPFTWNYNHEYLLFQRLRKLSPVTDESQYVSAKIVRNRDKNRYSNVLPGAVIVLNFEIISCQLKPLFYYSKETVTGDITLHFFKYL